MKKIIFLSNMVLFVRNLRRLPFDIYHEVAEFCHRGRYGWAKSDAMQPFMYANGVMLDMLLHMKNKPAECPALLLEENTPIESIEEGIKIWLEILDKIIAGLEAAERLNTFGYEIELRKYAEDPKAREKYLRDLQKLERRDIKTFNAGMKLLTKYYGYNLWD
jgi:hypothetical protein